MEHGFFKVGLTNVLTSVHVDHGKRFGVLNDERTT